MAHETLTIEIRHFKDGSKTVITETAEGVPVNDGYLYQSTDYLARLSQEALRRAYGSGIQRKEG